MTAVRLTMIALGSDFYTTSLPCFFWQNNGA